MADFTDEELIQRHAEARKVALEISDELRKRGYHFETLNGARLIFPEEIRIYKYEEIPVVEKQKVYVK